MVDRHSELLKRKLLDAHTDALIDSESPELEDLVSLMLEDDTLSASTKLEVADLLYRLNHHS